MTPVAHLMRIACYITHSGWAIRMAHSRYSPVRIQHLGSNLHRARTSFKKLIPDPNPNGTMTTTASPASFGTISPAPEQQSAPISIDHLLHLLGQIRVSQEEPASFAAPSSPYMPAAATPTNQPKVTLSISLSSVPPPAPPLESIIANRVIVLPNQEASRAEHALNEPHPVCCDQNGLSEENLHKSNTTMHSVNDNSVPSRHRALSAPVNGVELPSNAVLPVEAIVPMKSGPRKDDGAPPQKQTKREWLADLDRVSNVLSAMFEDGDRCARYA